MRRHAAYLVEFYGDEDRGCRDIRKHIAWYLKGFPAGGSVRSSLALVDSLAYPEQPGRAGRLGAAVAAPAPEPA